MKAEITKIPNLTTNGVLKTSGGDGTLVVDNTGLPPVGGTEGQVLTKVDGTDYNYQWGTPWLGGRNYAPDRTMLIEPVGGTSIAPSSIGVSIGQLCGSLSALAPTYTNLATSLRRIGWFCNSGLATGLVLNFNVIEQFHFGQYPYSGGFTIECVFTYARIALNSSSFVGLSVNNVTNDFNGVKTNFINCIGVGFDSADTNISIIHNDATGTATKISTGIVVPTVNDADVYRIYFHAEPNSSSVYYEFTEVVTNITVSGTISTNLPANTVRMSYFGTVESQGLSPTDFGLVRFWAQTKY